MENPVSQASEETWVRKEIAVTLETLECRWVEVDKGVGEKRGVERMNERKGGGGVSEWGREKNEKVEMVELTRKGK